MSGGLCSPPCHTPGTGVGGTVPDGRTLAFGVHLSVVAQGPARDKEHVPRAAFGSPVRPSPRVCGQAAVQVRSVRLRSLCGACRWQVVAAGSLLGQVGPFSPHPVSDPGRLSHTQIRPSERRLDTAAPRTRRRSSADTRTDCPTSTTRPPPRPTWAARAGAAGMRWPRAPWSLPKR